jgi:hypothetical protein
LQPIAPSFNVSRAYYLPVTSVTLSQLKFESNKDTQVTGYALIMLTFCCGSVACPTAMTNATAAEIGTCAARLAILQPPSDAGRLAQLTK